MSKTRSRKPRHPVEVARTYRKHHMEHIILVVGPVTFAEQKRLIQVCSDRHNGARIRSIKMSFSWFGGESLIQSSGGLCPEYFARRLGY